VRQLDDRVALNECQIFFDSEPHLNQTILPRPQGAGEEQECLLTAPMADQGGRKRNRDAEARSHRVHRVFV
jgi:hypothetical protein